MVNQVFHVVVGVIMRGWNQLGIIHIKGAIGHLFYGLFDNAKRLPHFLDSDHIAVEAISVCAGGHIKIESVINQVGLVLADIPSDPAGP